MSICRIRGKRFTKAPKALNMTLLSTQLKGGLISNLKERKVPQMKDVSGKVSLTEVKRVEAYRTFGF